MDEEELAEAVQEDDSVRARDAARQAARAIMLALEAQRLAAAPPAAAAVAAVSAPAVATVATAAATAPSAAQAMATPAQTRSKKGLAALARTLSPGT